MLQKCGKGKATMMVLRFNENKTFRLTFPFEILLGALECPEPASAIAIYCGFQTVFHDPTVFKP